MDIQLFIVLVTVIAAAAGLYRLLRRPQTQSHTSCSDCTLSAQCGKKEIKSASAGLYTHIWRRYLPEIITTVQRAYRTDETLAIQLCENDFVCSGNRRSYSFTITYRNGISPLKKGSAVARDLQKILGTNLPFKNFAAHKEITIRLSSTFSLHISAADI